MLLKVGKEEIFHKNMLENEEVIFIYYFSNFEYFTALEINGLQNESEIKVILHQ